MLPVVERFLVTADWHEGNFRNGPMIDGVNGRLLDIRDRIREILQYALSNNIKVIVILGDLFNDKSPSMIHLTYFAEFVREATENDITIVVLTGNHDVYKLQGQMHALAPFQKIQVPKLVVIDQLSDFRWELPKGLKIAFFPYIKSPQKEALASFLKPTDTALFMHGTISGASTRGCTELEMFDDDVVPHEMLSHLKGVFAGHVHSCQHFENVYYPGSIERLTFEDEKDTKSFLDVIWEYGDFEVKPIPLKARKMITLPGNMIQDVEKGRISVKDAIVRVLGADRHLIQETRQILMRQGCYYVASVQTAVKDMQAVESAPTTTDLKVFVDKFAKKQKYTGDLDAAMKMINGILESVETGG